MDNRVDKIFCEYDKCNKKSVIFAKIWNNMASDLAEQLERISDKSRLLLIRFGELQKRNAALTSELQDMRATLVARDAEIEKLRLELEYLRIATNIAPDSKSKEAVYATISDLVREIDRCITDLME